MKKYTLLFAAGLMLSANFAYCQWTTSGTNIYNTNTGNVGIGTTTPAVKLDIMGPGTNSLLRVYSNNAPSPAIIEVTASNSSRGTFESVMTPAIGVRIGSKNNYDFSLFSNDVNRMIIKTDGKVGIGTSTPTQLLDVNGTINATSFLLNGQPFTGGNTQWVSSGTNIINGNTGGGVRVSQDATNPASVPSYGNWAFFSQGTASHTSGTMSKVWGAYLLSLNVSTGTLDESAGAYITGGNESSGHGIVNTGYGVRARVQAGLGTVNTGYGVYIDNTAATSAFGLYQAGSDDHNYFAGDVGVGATLVTNPNGYKFAVNGKIGAKEVQVENTSTTWADYVFKSDYKLMPLEEVETFVKENSHLPEIPSAEEVKVNGHKLGEMDVLLLKKVEELTLYVIDLKKEVEKLKNENIQLKK